MLRTVRSAPCHLQPNLYLYWKVALCNALRYFPVEHHKVLAPEFLRELKLFGHIYMYRFRPTDYEMRAYPLQCYPAKCQEGTDAVGLIHLRLILSCLASAIMMMIQNNLDAKVSLFFSLCFRLCSQVAAQAHCSNYVALLSFQR